MEPSQHQEIPRHWMEVIRHHPLWTLIHLYSKPYYQGGVRYWRWTGRLSKNGPVVSYSVFRQHGIPVRQVLFITRYGKIPPGYSIYHLCNKYRCVDADCMYMAPRGYGKLAARLKKDPELRQQCMGEAQLLRRPIKKGKRQVGFEELPPYLLLDRYETDISGEEPVLHWKSARVKALSSRDYHLSLDDNYDWVLWWDRSVRYMSHRQIIEECLWYSSMVWDDIDRYKRERKAEQKAVSVS